MMETLPRIIQRQCCNASNTMFQTSNEGRVRMASTFSRSSSIKGFSRVHVNNQDPAFVLVNHTESLSQENHNSMGSSFVISSYSKKANFGNTSTLSASIASLGFISLINNGDDIRS